MRSVLEGVTFSCLASRSKSSPFRRGVKLCFSDGCRGLEGVSLILSRYRKAIFLTGEAIAATGVTDIEQNDASAIQYTHYMQNYLFSVFGQRVNNAKSADRREYLTFATI